MAIFVEVEPGNAGSGGVQQVVLSGASGMDHPPETGFVRHIDKAEPGSPLLRDRLS